ncbi:MAG: alpha/beta fold hydrolase [Phycisphaeraceae bacterium]
MRTLNWSIPGADGQPILGNTHVPSPSQGELRGVLLIAHGFRGYKDYGILPGIAHYAAMNGLVAIRFNFSHSGMTNQLDTFERKDLFEKDTWSKQILDLRAVATAASEGTLDGFQAARGFAQVWYGHSRGGVTVLLTAARAITPQHYPRIGAIVKPAGVIPCASPHRAMFLSEDDRRLLREQGHLDIQSMRTKEDLRIGADWLKEIERQPEAFDPVLAAKRVTCPIQLVYGDADQTVGLESGQAIAAAAPHANLQIIEGGSHVFNTTNPMNVDREPSPQGQALINAVLAFSARLLG